MYLLVAVLVITKPEGALPLDPFGPIRRIRKDKPCQSPFSHSKQTFTSCREEIRQLGAYVEDSSKSEIAFLFLFLGQNP
jgi:hypothetical protein